MRHPRLVVAVLALAWPFLGIAATLSNETAWALAFAAVAYWCVVLLLLRAGGWRVRTLALATAIAAAWYALVLPAGVRGDCFLEEGAHIACPGMDDIWALFWMVSLGFPLALTAVAMAPRTQSRKEANA
jgi:hypothetical protein